MKTQTDPKVDYAFKHVFGREQSKAALISLLNAVLQLSGDAVITSLELLSPFNEKDTKNAKLSIVDLKARDASGRQFYIEMQMLATSVFPRRALYYWACCHQDQLHESENYAALRPTIAVCFVDTPLFREVDDYHLVFELRERRYHTLFTDQLELHILELSKFNKGIGELTTPLDRWLFFLRHGEELDAEAVPEALDVPEVRWALGDLFMISRTDPERELYQARLKARRDAVAERQDARDDGLAEGRAEGRAVGLAEGRAVGLAEGRAVGLAEGRAVGLAEGRAVGLAEGRAEMQRGNIQSLQQSLGQAVTPLEDLQELSWDDLENIWARLQADLHSKLSNRK